MMLIAEAGKHIDPIVAKQLVENRYVDDGALGGVVATVQRMRGDYSIDENGVFTSNGTLSQLLALAGMKAKMIIMS